MQLNTMADKEVLVERIKELQAALKPFALLASAYEGMTDAYQIGDRFPFLTVGDLRQAARLVGIEPPAKE